MTEADRTGPLHLTTAHTVARAHAELALMRDRLSAAGVPGALSLTGGSSLEGLWTKGDVDLHLRVSAEQFEAAGTRLRRLLVPARREIWTTSFAAFERPGEPPLGIALTVIGCEHDRRFVRSWQRMAADPVARQRYNALKLLRGNVEAAKSAFFDELST